jgi:copper oxidase (laccase) domain-containing protein
MPVGSQTRRGELGPVERFAALSAQPICQHGFITRIAGIDVSQDKEEALKRLEAAHQKIRSEIGLAHLPLFTAEQIHGDKIAIVDQATQSDTESAGCDGLITNQRAVLLGIHVADCCAVYIVDPKTPAIGLVHSGKKGTGLGIAAKAIERMRQKFGSDPANLIVQLSPCIRPPHYEIDFAAEIIRQCRSAGVKEVHDTGACTACDLDRYYSYRREKGKTGRMLALLGLSS